MPGGASSSYFRVGDNVELWRVVVYLCVLIIMVMVLEQIMHRTEHALKKYPKYHEMLSKIYRELMILGLLGLGIKFVKEMALVDGYGKNLMAFQVADLIVFISAFALIIQAIAVFSLMRSKNKQMDKDELVSSYDLIELVTRHQIMLRSQTWLRRLWPWTRAPASGVGIEGSKITFSTARYDEMVTTRTLRYYFLHKYGLPELFPFSKYLRQAQDHQITHMIDIEMSMWILLILLTWALDASTQLLEGLHHELERYALVTMFLVFAWALTFLHLVVSWYLRSSVKQILAVVGYRSHRDMLDVLRKIAEEEERNLELQKADNALEMMQHVQEEHESQEHGHGHGGGHGDGHGGGGHEEGGHGGSCMDHDTGFQVVAALFRKMCGKKKKKEEHHEHAHPRGAHAPVPLPEVKIRFFSRIGLHFVVKFLIMLNGFYFAFMCQAVLYEMDEIFTKFGVLAAVMVPTPLLINMFVFQPTICRNYVQVSCIFKVDVPTLSEVITHFSESVELRSDFVTCLKQSMRDHGLGIEQLHAEFLARDPANTGYVELEVLRQVLRAFGCQISFFRFNGIAKLLFRLKGTRVEYAQIERLLTLAEKEDKYSDSVASSQCATAVTTMYPRYLSTVIAEETEVQHRERFSVASSRFSEDIVMLESMSFSKKHQIPSQQKSQEHTVQVTGRFGLPRFSSQHVALPTTVEQSEMHSPPRTARDNGGLPSMKGGHGYHEV